MILRADPFGRLKHCKGADYGDKTQTTVVALLPKFWI
jgi:hypothetical protein